jgi:phosphatidylinositol 4-kinase
VLKKEIINVTSYYKFFHIGSGEKLFLLYDKLEIKHGLASQDRGESSDFYSTQETISAYNSEVYTAENFDDVQAKHVPLNVFNGTKSFMSTLDFIEKLTEISHKLLSQVHKTEWLKEQLRKLNKLLPSEVYIPFNSYKARQSAVLHIPVSEARVFTTKERAPFKICVEVFRPYKEIKDEAARPVKNVLKPSRSNSVPVAGSRSTSFQVSDASDSIAKSLESNSTRNSLLFEESLPRRRNQTFATSLDVDPLHYEKFLINELGSLSAVYGEVDEAGKNVSVFKESFKQQSKRIRDSSPYGKFKTWGLMHVIVKSGDDLRQEQFAMQLISFFKQTFDEKELGIWLYPYDILATGLDCGILECVPDAVSIDGLKKSLPPDRATLNDFFLLQFGEPKTKRFKLAKQCFMKSLVGYSLVCYILQIKDRHNGNILIDRNGHIIHIDFGFLLSNSPGGNMNFEQAPFKLTNEFERILGGRRSKLFQEFRHLCVKGYRALKEKSEQIILMVEMMRAGSGSNFGCFIGGDNTISDLRERLKPKQKMNEKDCKEYINELIDISLDNWSTKCYDRFQYCCQNIFY